MVIKMKHVRTELVHYFEVLFSVYFLGNDVSYHLQASCDDDKKKWIEAFQKVFETLKTSTSS